MALDERFERALRSSNPGSCLRELARDLYAQGYDQPQVIETFENARAQLRLADRESDEDAILDVMDCIFGWCAPHAAVLPPSRQAESDNKP